MKWLVRLLLYLCFAGVIVSVVLGLRSLIHTSPSTLAPDGPSGGSTLPPSDAPHGNPTASGPVTQRTPQVIDIALAELDRHMDGGGQSLFGVEARDGSWTFFDAPGGEAPGGASHRLTGDDLARARQWLVRNDARVRALRAFSVEPPMNSPDHIDVLLVPGSMPPDTELQSTVQRWMTDMGCAVSVDAFDHSFRGDRAYQDLTARGVLPFDLSPWFDVIVTAEGSRTCSDVAGSDGLFTGYVNLRVVVLNSATGSRLDSTDIDVPVSASTAGEIRRRGLMLLARELAVRKWKSLTR